MMKSEGSVYGRFTVWTTEMNFAIYPIYRSDLPYFTETKVFCNLQGYPHESTELYALLHSCTRLFPLQYTKSM